MTATMMVPPKEPPLKTPDQQAQSDEMKAQAARRRERPTFTGGMMRRAVKDSFVKLDPRTLAKNPVMFVVEVGSVITSVATVVSAVRGSADFWFALQTTLWLWFTVLFAN